jgi:hypothetical protein
MSLDKIGFERKICLAKYQEKYFYKQPYQLRCYIKGRFKEERINYSISICNFFDIEPKDAYLPSNIDRKKLQRFFGAK